MPDPFELSRFVEAQAPTYRDVLQELRSGRKRSHWMWFIFPQIAGLGSSAMARRYAISGIDEARAYADHPILGGRLIECTQLALAAAPGGATSLFGRPDDLKFRSSMTLFDAAAADRELFASALQQFFDGVPDHLTLERISHTGASRQ